MGLPTEEQRPPVAVNGSYYAEPHDQQQSNGQQQQSNLPLRSYPSTEMTATTRDRGDSNTAVDTTRDRPARSRRPSGQRMCGKCGRTLTGQFVRALGDTYHLECFTCHDCDKIVASKFFPVPDHPPNQYPLCETDYFRRLDLLCHACSGALRGSYITALDRKYHIEHFTCSVCPTVFGAQDSYYEHESNVYCHFHYSTRFAQKCNGCQTAILKQFVEIFRNGADQHWHPECYMIHKYWNVRLHAPPPKGAIQEEQQEDKSAALMAQQEASEELRRTVRDDEESVERKVHWIWQTLSTFEERSATCISDMLLHVSNGAYMDGVVAAKKFITHVDLLFAAADDLDHRLQIAPQGSTRAKGEVRTFEAIVHPGLSYGREAKLLCKKVVAFFQLLAESQDTGVRRLGVTQELLSLVTGLAHYLKLMIRICLSGALKLERETGSAEGLEGFLEDISKLDDRLDLEERREEMGGLKAVDVVEAYVDKTADTCAVCDKAVEDKCFRHGEGRDGVMRVLHTHCLVCFKCQRDFGDNPEEARWTERDQRVWCDVHAPGEASRGGFVWVSRLTQYVHLLRVAHARLLATLRTSGALPHTSDDPNLGGYDAGGRDGGGGDGSETRGGLMTRSGTQRSRSYAGRSGSMREKGRELQDSSYEDTMGDIRRLRSTRMDKQVSNAGKQARKSRIIDGMSDVGVRPGSAGDGRRRTGTFQIVEDRDANGEPISSLSFGGQDAMTLDDIPRIVQAQQTREQRPNASKYARSGMLPQEPKPRLINGHTRDFSDQHEGERQRGSGVGVGNGRGETMEEKIMGRPAGTKRYFSELTALEYFIVRHVAVLSMEPLLEGHFNQEELLDLIETKRPTFWAKFGKAFQGKSASEKKVKGKAPNAIFGVPLEQLLERDYEESTDGVGPGSLKVPSLVQEAISAMKTMDMSVEGVFRKNGNIKRLNDFKEEIDNKGGTMDVDLTKENPVQVAALLKKFLRELPDPLLTHKLHRLFITSQRIEDGEKRRRVLHLTCCLLPKPHRDTMEVLFTFLKWVSSFSHVDEESGSKMDVHNLATVVTPNVLHRGKEIVPVDDAFLAIEAVHSLIEFNEGMCEVPEDLAMILNDSSLFSSTADITTKEILKRYGDRAKAPTLHSSPLAGAEASNNGTTSPAGGPVATRVDTDPSMQNAWQHETSVRHVGAAGDASATPPNLPYAANGGAGRRDSGDSHGSPNRGSIRAGQYDKQRAMGMA
ncbi:Rho-type GTPase activating protein Rga1 [Elasticomyces elasticus]|nr:Rho-type GTPase activating protein Rga1 [Elasticomyces elasticus]